MVDNFHFLRPAWLYMLLPLLGLLIYMLKYCTRNSGWQAVCDNKLLPYILTDSLEGRQRMILFLVATGGLLGILALAGPVWERLPQAVFEEQTAWVIALDLSPTMDAEDIKPSRLERARFKIEDILRLHDTGQTALLVYAADAYTVTPLTSDVKTISSQLSALTTDIMPAAGSNMVAVLEKAAALLKQGGIASGDVLLITDGIDNNDRNEHAVSTLLKQGYHLSVLGIGTKDGAPVSLPGGGFLKDQHGAIILSSYDDRGTRQLAVWGRGIYQEMTTDDTDIKNILRFIDLKSQVPEQGSESEFQVDIWQERGPWLLLLLLPLAAYSFRRGYLPVIFILLVPYPEPVYAFDWKDLWLRTDQQAARDFEKGNYKKAAQKFSHPAWQAAAYYQAGDFAAASEILNNAEDAGELYNKGNALAKLGKYEEAIKAYNQFLKLMPDNEDVQHNLALVKKELQKRQDEQQTSGDQQGEQQHAQSADGQQNEQQYAQSVEGEQGEQGEQQHAQSAGDNQDEQGEQQNNYSQQDEQSEQGDDQQQQLVHNQDNGEEDAQQSMQQADNQQSSLMPTIDEKSQATEQWLRRIPDDPGKLLRRKFLYQYRQRDGQR